ncbi:hypothetical protein ABW20_dc0105801 [Dactylellina cionopaga]|nr:hypothetical protein ABW20_dc0105801 [Dactylellina cionopaga]
MKVALSSGLLPSSRLVSCSGHVSHRLSRQHASVFSTSAARHSTTAEAPKPPGTPYSNLTVGVPRETFPNERRVAIAPQNVAQLRKKGFKKVIIEKSAGAESSFTDHAYEAAGATVGDRKSVWSESDILLKVRAPNLESEVPMVRSGSTLVSFLQPAINTPLVEALANQGATTFAMDMIPRISRAQSFDALSSMANIAGYKAVLEASNHFGRFLTGQVTAAGKIPPCKVLVIGAGVAGLSAIVTARRMGAIVRGFDTREAALEQIQSLGAEPIRVDFEESGEGGGGYAKVMSKEFIAAEMKLFHEQAKEVDIIITTALIPGKPAPRLITEEMIASMKPGSVIVDLAAEAGGNVALTKPGEVVTINDVHIIGYTDLPSRLPTQSSTLYGNNITKFLLSMEGADKSFAVDLNDEVVRGSIVTQNGKILPTTPRPVPPPPPAKPKVEASSTQTLEITPWQKVTKDVAVTTGGLGALLALGKATSPIFMGNIFTFGLAGLVGYRAVWGVQPALHSPLMSVTNAISGMVGVGGFFLMGGGYFPGTFPQLLGALSVGLAFVNVSGGFVITKRMLDMFKRPTDPPEYGYLWAVPGLVFGTAFVASGLGGMDGLSTAGYLASSLLCIASISGLSSQVTARRGNILGMLGVAVGVLAAISSLDFSPQTMTQFAVLAALGGAVGAAIGFRITPTSLPQTVAGMYLHESKSPKEGRLRIFYHSSSLRCWSCR